MRKKRTPAPADLIADDERLAYSLERAAAKLDVSIRHLYTLAERGELQIAKIGKRSIVSAAWVHAQIPTNAKERPHVAA